MIFRSQRVENSFLLVHLFTDILLFSSCADAITVALYPAGPSGAYSPDGGGMGYMMDGGAAAAAAMMHRPPADPMAFHSEYHYPPQYYGHHLWRSRNMMKWHNTRKEKKKRRWKHFCLFQEKYDTKYVKISLPPQQSFVLQFVHLPKKLLTLITWKKKLFLKIITT